MEQNMSDDVQQPKVLFSRLDGAGFNYLTVIAQPDTMTGETVTATVLFGSYPVAMVTTDNADSLEGEDDYGMPSLGAYRMSPLVDELFEWRHNSPQAQAYVAFLVEIGTIMGEGSLAWMDEEHAMHTLFDEYGDDGHAWVAFLGEVATAIHTAFPDRTPEPTGF